MKTGEPLRPAVVAAPVPSETASPPVPTAPAAATAAAAPPAPATTRHADPLAAERYRVALGYECDAHALRGALASARAHAAHGRAIDEERHALQRALAEAHAETARYRQVLVDLENDAPPPLLDGRGAPDDLRLIVGVGPVLERMLQQLGVGTYRQIARWSERDIDEFDAKLPEFHGRIRRDDWVTQARLLHQSKYGELPSPLRG